MEDRNEEQIYNDKLKATRRAVIGWVFVWTYIALLYVVFGSLAIKVVIILAIGYDLLLHFFTALKDPYERKVGWIFYPIIFQRDETTKFFDYRYHLFWIPFWFTVLTLVILAIQ